MGEIRAEKQGAIQEDDKIDIYDMVRYAKSQKRDGRYDYKLLLPTVRVTSY